MLVPFFVGARYVENCKVLQVLTENARIKGVETNMGTVFCEYFVNSAGMVKKCWLDLLYSESVLYLYSKQNLVAKKTLLIVIEV
jgi:glycine/D-amino acid oxidase-like deaminating enzyme